MTGAHLDSWHGATGATDNAAGSAVVMEAMRFLKALDLDMIRVVLQSRCRSGTIALKRNSWTQKRANCDANHILIGRSSARLGARTHATKLQRCVASAGNPGGVRSSIVLHTGATIEPQDSRIESFERHRYVAQFTD